MASGNVDIESVLEQQPHSPIAVVEVDRVSTSPIRPIRPIRPGDPDFDPVADREKMLDFLSIMTGPREQAGE